MKFADMQSVEDIPADLPNDKLQQDQWLERLAMKIVDRVWHEPEPDVLKAIQEGYRHDRYQSDSDEENFFPFCFCNEGNLKHT